MVSFLNTGQADQSILEDLRPGEWLNTNRTFKNYCGSIGSIIAYTLITVNFGLPAFIIPVFLIIVGLKMMKICTINPLEVVHVPCDSDDMDIRFVC